MKRILTRQSFRSILKESGFQQHAPCRQASVLSCIQNFPATSSGQRRKSIKQCRTQAPARSISAASDLRSTLPDVDIPDVSFAEFILSRMAEFKDTPALLDFPTGRSYTYSQVRDYSMKVASALHRRGYRKGDVITTCTINLPEFTFLILAAASLGVVLSPVNPTYTAGELSRVVTHNDVRAMVTIPQLLPMVQEVINDPELPHNVKEVFTFGHGEKGAVPFSELMGDDGQGFPENVDIAPATDTLFLPYSSGTTGLPKGVMLSHKNIVANILQFRELLRVSPEEKTIGLLPFFHIYGLTAVQFGSLYDGAELVTVPRFEPELFLKTMSEKKVSILHAVPPIVLFLAKHPMVSGFDLSTVKYMVSGAAPLGLDLTHQCQDRLGFPIYQGYGLTETSPVINVDAAPGHPGTIGLLIPNTKAKIVDVETGLPVEAGQLGEYCMDGPQKMLGYLKNQEATDEMIDKDGWLHTGDIGYLRDDGFVVIEDRLKELIKYKGYQVPPAELEGLLLSHPAVQDAGVIGIPDDEAGELPRAYVVLKPNVKATAEDITKFVEENVSPTKRLRGGVEFIPEIPKSQSGKILRRVLKAQALQTS